MRAWSDFIIIANHGVQAIVMTDDARDSHIIGCTKPPYGLSVYALEKHYCLR
jgi:hypothetical protein